jgi:peptide-methionine (S)-S-oxide reductase
MTRRAIALLALGIVAMVVAAGCAVSTASAEAEYSGSRVGTDPGQIRTLGPVNLKPRGNDQIASFSGGCFWGTEDIFRQVPGVVATAVGYTGGNVSYPTYEQVCTHTTGHAETVLVEFDPSRISYEKLLSVFWENHDPTTLDSQGPDFGNNYRSAIWCYTMDEYKAAKKSRTVAQSKLTHKIVTEIHMAQPFYLAEDYHQQYDEKHGTHFCPIGHGT